MADSEAKPTAAPVNKASEDTSAPAPATADTSAAVAAANTPTTDVDTTAATNDTPDSTENTEATEPTEVEVSEDMKRPELNAIATEAGLTNVSKYANKGVVVDAINRVRGGEDATAVDTELAPVVDDKGGDVEVTVAAPFYDLEQSATRRVGDTYKTTETRAAELRGRSLIK